MRSLVDSTPYSHAKKARTPDIHVPLSPAQPSVVYDTYWRFAVERQAVFFRRFTGEPYPWTHDPILREYKFTNAYRAADRVSQHLIRNIIYEGDDNIEEVFFRTLVFKLFNKIETWRLLCDNLSGIRFADYDFRRYDDILSRALTTKKTIYSAAYIMPSGAKTFGTRRKHQAHLKLLERMMDDEVPLRLANMSTMLDAFRLLLSYPLLGDFLAYQYITDLNYSTVTNFQETEFVVPGPGARGGIRKCFESLGGYTEADIIKLVMERQEHEFNRLELDFQSLWGRPLQLIDCQNLFCEVDKYSRVAHPEVLDLSGRTRIKQKFRSNPMPVDYWFPPKWGVNEAYRGKPCSTPLKPTLPTRRGEQSLTSSAEAVWRVKRAALGPLESCCMLPFPSAALASDGLCRGTRQSTLLLRWQKSSGSSPDETTRGSSPTSTENSPSSPATAQYCMARMGIVSVGT